MGHYCADCGEKLVGGIVPNSCDCVECYCSKCWENLFQGVYVKTTKTYFTYDENGKLVKNTENLYVVDVSEAGRCDRCGTSFEGEDNYRYYNNR